MTGHANACSICTCNLARPPDDLAPERQGGLGLTMSLFISELAFGVEAAAE